MWPASLLLAFIGKTSGEKYPTQCIPEHLHNTCFGIWLHTSSWSQLEHIACYYNAYLFDIFYLHNFTYHVDLWLFEVRWLYLFLFFVLFWSHSYWCSGFNYGSILRNYSWGVWETYRAQRIKLGLATCCTITPAPLFIPTLYFLIFKLPQKLLFQRDINRISS